MKNSLLVFGTKNFNNSLKEIKEFLNFSLIFYDKNTLLETSIITVNALLVDSDFCNNKDIVLFINNLKKKPLLLLKRSTAPSNIKIAFDATFTLPLSFIEIFDKLSSLVSAKIFYYNSCLKIKEYEVDKNERKLKKDNLSITITEREIQLIELLFNEKRAIPKSIILKKVWKYSDDADTHTIETHIYRLRKKILSKFKDENFIINTKNGYTI